MFVFFILIVELFFKCNFIIISLYQFSHYFILYLLFTCSLQPAADNFQQKKITAVHATAPSVLQAKLRTSQQQHQQNVGEAERLIEPVNKFTLHTSHLPLPQCAVRVADANSKVAKTAVNQSRKVSTISKGSSSSKEGSGTEDSGVGSQPGSEKNRNPGFANYSARASRGRTPRNLRMVYTGNNSFDVRDVDDNSTVTEISVTPLPKLATPLPMGLTTGFVRERASQLQRALNKELANNNVRYNYSIFTNKIIFK